MTRRQKRPTCRGHAARWGLPPWRDTAPRDGRVPPAWTYKRRRPVPFDVQVKDHETGKVFTVRVRERSMADAAGAALRLYPVHLPYTAHAVARAQGAR